LPRGHFYVIENGLKINSDHNFLVCKVWRDTAKNQPNSPSLRHSVHRLEFKGEVAAYVYMLWLVLGSKNKAIEAVYEMCSAKAAALGLVDRGRGITPCGPNGPRGSWGIKTPETYFDHVSKSAKFLKQRLDGKPVLKMPSVLEQGVHYEAMTSDVVQCLDNLIMCERYMKRIELSKHETDQPSSQGQPSGENLMKLKSYIEDLAAKVYGPELLPKLAPK